MSVTNWYDPELKPQQISLDPKRDGLENVERLFQKHRKAMKGAELAEVRLSKIEHQLSEIEGLSQEYHKGPLNTLRTELQLLGVFREKQRPPSKKGRRRDRLSYRIFHSVQGEVIWLGRGGTDNHITTFQCARGQDHWLHTRDVPGAHVIIPLPRRGHQPHFETIQDAAALAVHHSRLRGEEGVAVYHTARKHIRPIPNAAPGKVMVASSQTVTPYNVSQRIERLYQQIHNT